MAAGRGCGSSPARLRPCTEVTRGSGFDDAKLLVDPDYSGVLVRDGWAPYRSYAKATHQSCVTHLARRCHELKAELPAHQHGLSDPRSGASFDEALAWRDEIRPVAECADAAVELHDRLLTICNDTIIGDRNKTSARHLIRKADAIFTFLTRNNDAANWRAEQAIRPAVVNLKPHHSAGRNLPGSAISGCLVMAGQCLK